MLYPNNTTNQIVARDIERKIKLLKEANERNASEITNVGGAVNSLSDRTSATEDDIADIKGEVETINGEIDDINDALEGKQDTLEILDDVTANSNNPVKSSGIYNALQEKINTNKIKDNPEPHGTDVLSTGGAYDIVQDIGEQLDKIREDIIEAGLAEIDEVPTEGSRALVRSGGVYDAIEDAKDAVKAEVVTGVKGSAEDTYRTGNVNITKDNIGLGNVNNTSDMDKPVSQAQYIELNKKITANNITKPYSIKETDTRVVEYYKLWQFTGNISELDTLRIYGVIGNILDATIGQSHNSTIDISVNFNNYSAVGYVSNEQAIEFCDFAITKYRASGASVDTYTLYFRTASVASASIIAFNGYVETNLQTLYDTPVRQGAPDMWDRVVMLLSENTSNLHIGNNFPSLKTDSITAYTNNGEIDVNSTLDLNNKNIGRVNELGVGFIETGQISHPGVMQISGVAGITMAAQADITLNAGNGTRITPKTRTSTTGSIPGLLQLNWTDIDRGNVHTVIGSIEFQTTTGIVLGQTLSIDLEDITGISSANQNLTYRVICYAVRKYYNSSANANIVQCLLHYDDSSSSESNWKLTFLDVIPADGDVWEITPIIISM